MIGFILSFGPGRSVRRSRRDAPHGHFPQPTRHGMRLQPQHPGGCGWIDGSLSPPCRFVATAMDLAMMERVMVSITSSFKPLIYNSD